MGIKHADTKASGDRGYADEWNKEHVIDSDVDFNKFELLQAAVENRTSFPAAPATGQVIYRTDRNTFYIYDGTNWNSCNLARKAATFVVAASNSTGKYGADYVCDGTADEVEINQALNALPATGGKVLLLEGTYNIAATISILKSDVVFQGCGWGTKIFLSDGANADVITLGDAISLYQRVIIRDMKIDGNNTQQTANGHIIFLNRTIRDSIIENIYALNGRAGILIDNNCYNNMVINCFIENTGKDTSSYGIEIDQASNYTIIKNNELYSCHNGIWVARSYYAIVENNVCEMCNNNGILIMDSQFCTVNGNVCNNNGVTVDGSSGIVLAYIGFINCSYNTLTANICRDTLNTQDYGIGEGAANVDNNIIVGNVCYGNDVTNILVSGAFTIEHHNKGGTEA